MVKQSHRTPTREVFRMKFLFLILAGLTLYVAYINGQICQGRPVFQLCTGGKDEGNRNGRLCGLTAQNGMWFYNSRNRKCEKMNYRGCGGNGNRYCKVEDCNRCRR